MTQVWWAPSLLGGVIIGLAAALLLWGNGRLAGISGVVGRLFSAREPGDLPDERSWRLTFVAGLLLGGVALSVAYPSALGAAVRAPGSGLVVAGLLVGVGTQLANGCTSGHGVCGLARGSTRSLAATVTFMVVAGVTVWVERLLTGGLS